MIWIGISGAYGIEDLLELPENEKTKLRFNPALKLGVWRISMRSRRERSSFVFEMVASLAFMTQFHESIFETNEDECAVPVTRYERLGDSKLANTTEVLNAVSAAYPYPDHD